MDTQTLIKLKLAKHPFVQDMSWLDILSTDLIKWGISIIIIGGMFLFLYIKKCLNKNK